VRFEEKKENKLGSGMFGVVYRGTFEGNAVAVKVTVKVHLDDTRKQEQKREMEEHFRLHHENVLKLLHVDDSRDKTYYKRIKKIHFYHLKHSPTFQFHSQMPCARIMCRDTHPMYC
jgi:hypothetical protein